MTEESERTCRFCGKPTAEHEFWRGGDNKRKWAHVECIMKAGREAIASSFASRSTASCDRTEMMAAELGRLVILGKSADEMQVEMLRMFPEATMEDWQRACGMVAALRLVVRKPEGNA